MIVKWSVVTMAMAWCCNLAYAQSDTLVVAFNNKPPFFYFEAGEAKGIVVERAKQILQRAGVPYQFQELPFNRVMGTLKNGTPQFAALGFSQTPERAAFAAFSLPIYRDQPPVLLVRSADAEKFRAFPTFDKLVDSAQFSFGGKQGNAYPIDAQLKRLGARDIRFAVESLKLPQLLVAGRFDFTLLYPEELSMVASQTHTDPGAVQQISYPDLPAGGLRYFLFSKGVPQTTVDKINKAISKVIPAKL